VSKLRVQGMSISLDGYEAGPSQSESDPLGVNQSDDVANLQWKVALLSRRASDASHGSLASDRRAAS